MFRRTALRKSIRSWRCVTNEESTTDAPLAAAEDFGDDLPVDPNFHPCRLPDGIWHRSKRCDSIEAVIQLQRLRELLALVGFTRFEAVTPDINGEYATDVERAQIALEPAWFPAAENRGRGCSSNFVGNSDSRTTEADAAHGYSNHTQHLRGCGLERVG